MTKVFSSVLIALDVAAAVVYATCGDWRRFIYWLAAYPLSEANPRSGCPGRGATLTATVTF